MKRTLDANEDFINALIERMSFKAPSWFYSFHKMCVDLDAKNPLSALESIGLWLVGPFEALQTESTTDDSTWAYFYDPPEVSFHRKKLLNELYFSF